METITVQVLNFETYKGRQDVKHNSWFRCSNRLLEDPDFYHFTFEEIGVWIMILSLVSQKNKPVVEINLEWADRVCRLKKKVVQAALEKLEGKQIDILHDTSTLRARNVHDTSTCATDRQTRQDITDRTVQERSAKPLHPLAQLWNDFSKDLPKVHEVSAKRTESIRERLKECPDLETWKSVIQRIAASDFCNGRVEGKKWKASFDFLLRPNTRIKALEGQYDNFGTEAGQVRSMAEILADEAGGSL